VKRVLTVLVVVSGCLALATPASAQTYGPGDEQIVLSGELIIGEGETVDTAVIFNGPATIQGTVTGTVVVFNGDTEISGSVEDDVVVFNGETTVRSGATIGGDLATVDAATVEEGATIEGEQRRMRGDIDATAFGFASRFIWWLGYTISTLILGLVVLALAPRFDLSVVEAARRQTGASIGFGIAGFFLLPVIAVLLIVIVVAIPLGLFLLLALGLLYTLGYVASAHVLGRRLVLPPKSRFGAFIAGWAILRGMALIPFLGGLTWLVASVFGLGVLWVAMRRSTTAEPPAETTPVAARPVA
jgi:magnesium-transporting ATPase (P-type)